MSSNTNVLYLGTAALINIYNVQGVNNKSPELLKQCIWEITLGMLIDIIYSVDIIYIILGES